MSWITAGRRCMHAAPARKVRLDVGNNWDTFSVIYQYPDTWR
jgi:hypothetical protein